MMHDTSGSRLSYGANRLVQRVAERKARNYIEKFCNGFSVEDLQYAAEHRLDIVRFLLSQYLLTPGQEKTARKKAQSYRDLFEELATVDNVLRAFRSASAEHAEVLEAHQDWLQDQIQAAHADLFSPG